MGTYDSNTTASTTGTVYYVAENSTCTDCGPFRFCVPQPKRYLIKHPTRWKQKGKDAFIKLVNDDTSTGWKVTMVINGKVELIDPNIEVITAKKFLEIMRWSASQEDKVTLDRFTEEWKS